LSWQQVAGIRERFTRLNPYDPEKIPGSVLKLKDVNLDVEGSQRPLWCYAISAKCCCLYVLDDQGEPVLVKWSEHGLRHLLNPTAPDSDDRDWLRQVWEGIVRDELVMAPLLCIQTIAALVSRPPVKAIPTFWPVGRVSRMAPNVFFIWPMARFARAMRTLRLLPAIIAWRASAGMQRICSCQRLLMVEGIDRPRQETLGPVYLPASTSHGSQYAGATLLRAGFTCPIHVSGLTATALPGGARRGRAKSPPP
jgi:hypothetical protein